MKRNTISTKLVIATVATIMILSAIPLMVSAEDQLTLCNNENGKAPLQSNGSKSDTFYAYNAYDTSMDEGPISFPSDDPGDITLLSASGMASFLTGGCFVEDVWYACEYTDGTSTYPDATIWTIDITDGSMTEVGDYGLTSALNGLAYDDSTETLYGCTGTGLYTIDVNDGSSTFIATMNNPGLIVGIASDGEGTIYGIELNDESLYSIDPSDGSVTLIGDTGLTLNYAQDMAYDKNNDILYLAAYEDPGDGSLQICDVTDGSTTLVGAFGVLEVTAFAIPYDFFTPEHDISVTDIDVPDTVPHGDTQTVSATVNNIGNNTETGIVVDFKVDGFVEDTVTIPSLASEESTPVSFTWDPAVGSYFVEIESQPITDEYDLLNNAVNKTVDVILAPDIDVDPTTLTFMIPPDTTDSKIVTITNLPTAEATLTYDITIDDGGSGVISVIPDSGSIAIDDYDDITVTVDSTGLTQGIYPGSIIIESNDLNNPEVVVSGELIVVYEDDMAALSINHPTGTIYDIFHTVNATVQNMGSTPQTAVTVNCSIFEGGLGGEVINEDFSTDPIDWTITNIVGTAWTWDSTEERMEHSYSGSPSGYLDSPVLDCSGKTGISLSFWHYWKADYSSGNQDGYVRGSTDGGATFPYLIDEFHHNDPAEETAVKTYDISSWANNQAQVMIRFDVVNDNDWYWYIDDFIVEATIAGDLIYFAETLVDLDAYESDFVEFSPAWDAEVGTYGIQVTTMLAGDENTGNDLTSELVTVEVLPMPVINLNTGEGFDTIQEAIDDPDTLDGHAIQVTEGEFAGAIVNKSLTILGSGSKGPTIITSGVHYGGSAPNLETAFLLEPNADGSEIRDFTIACNSTTNFYFAIFSREIDNVTIDSLIVDDAVQGISNSGGSNWTITNNVLTDTEASGGGGIGIYLSVRPPNLKCNDNLVEGNIISSSSTEPGYTAPGICLAIDTRYGGYEILTGFEEVTNNLIVDNVITGTGNLNEVGIETGVIGVSGDPVKIAYTMGMIHDNSMIGNEVDGSDYGIYAYVVEDQIIEENEVKNCITHGVSIWDDFTGSINYNNIYDNGVGLYNDMSNQVAATCNWWGDQSGPYNDTFNVLGLGNSVIGNALFVPWLTDAFPTGDCNGYPGPVYNIDTDEVFTTIQAAIDDADTLNGHTLQIAAITHAEGPQIVISKDLTIQGYGCGQTIINPTGDTGGSGDARGWWLVNDGIEFHLSDLELDGTGFDIYQAIRHKGYGTIDQVCFNEIKYPSYGGVAVAAFGGGPVDVTNCQFTEIGRVGVLYWVTGSLFQGNTYVGKGDGDWLDYCLDIGGGGGVTVTGNTVSGCTGVASSDGSESAGFLVTTYFAPGTHATIEENEISDCTMAIAVGYNETDTSSVVANYNNFANCEWGISTTAPVVEGTCNWWDDITGPYHEVNNPGGNGCNVSENVTFLPWLDAAYPYGTCSGGLEQLDVNQSVFDRGFPIRHTWDGDWGAAQNFTPIVSNGITKVEIYTRAFGSPEFDLTVELRTDHPEGTLLDTLTFTPAEVTSSWNWLEVDFEDTTIVPGTDYFIVLPPAPSGVSTSFGYEWGYAFGDQYQPGSFWFTRDGGGLWRDLPTMYEFVFKTYGF